MPLLTVKNLRTQFSTDRGTVRAGDGGSFSLEEGEVMGLVGESGSGKSITAMSIMRLIKEPPGKIEADEITFDGVNLLALTPAQLRDYRARHISMIFQDPMRSLNPELTIGRQLMETLQRHLRMSARDARRRSIELLEMVGIPRAEKRLDEYPHQFSGGMRQRVMIAIALSCNPRLLIADEATTALDVTIQAQIIDLIRRLRSELGTAVIWISHDLGLVAGLCDKVSVMYAGRIVESGPVREVFYRPAHGYTLGLMNCTPRVDDIGHRLRPIEGMPPNLAEPMPLCPFLPRCEMAVPACRDSKPKLEAIAEGHVASCHADLSAYWRKEKVA